MSKARRLISSFGKTASSNPFEDREGLVYARVSSKRQEIEGAGLQSQEGRCIKDLESISVPYTKSFLDSFTGGGDFIKRPAMREMLDYIDARPHKKFLVIFDDLKRFARDVEFHLKLRTALKARNVIIKCLNYSFDESPEGRFAEVVMAGQAELERHQNSRQVIQKQKARLEAGYWPFGGKKGYTITKDPLHGKLAIPNVEGLEMLKRALELFADGTLVRKVDVCRYLVEKGFWKRQRPEVYIDKITAILKDPFYVGDISYPAWEVARRSGHHKGVISNDTFDLIQKRIRKETVGARIRRDISPDFPLRGLTLCASCLRPVTAAWSRGGRKKNYGYYFCQHTSCENYRVNIRKKDIEDRFQNLLEASKLNPEVSKILKVVFDEVWKEETDELEKQGKIREKKRAELRSRIKELTDMVLKAKSNQLRDVYENQVEETASELDTLGEMGLLTLDLSIPYRTALEKATTLLKSPYTVWQSVSTVEKHHLFYFIFEEKLAYCHKDGYRTENSPTAVKLFGEFAGVNTLDVEMGGIEPPCMVMGRVDLQA